MRGERRFTMDTDISLLFIPYYFKSLCLLVYAFLHQNGCFGYRQGAPVIAVDVAL